MIDANSSRAEDCKHISCPTGGKGWTTKELVPFTVRRVYFMQDAAPEVVRGEHAHRTLVQLLVAVRGSFQVILKDGRNERLVHLDRPDYGLLVRAGVWNELRSFSPGGVCLVLASELFSEDDYICSWREFLEFKKLPSPA